MKKLLFVLIFIALEGKSFSVFEDLSAGPRADALGQAYTALATGTEGIYYNPAGAAFLKKSETSAFYKLLYGGLNVGLKTFNFAVFFPFKSLHMTISFKGTGASFKNKTGYDTLYTGSYAENALSLNFSKLFTENLAFGVNLNYYHVSVPGHSSLSGFGIDFGLLARFYDKFAIGGFVGNLNNPDLGNTGSQSSKLRVPIAIGFLYRPRKYLLTTIDIKKTKDFPASVSFGQELCLLNRKLALRLGLYHQGETTIPSFGFGINYKNFNFNYAAILHLNLPYTHEFGITFRR